MGVNYEMMEQAFREEKVTFSIADSYADDMCRMLDGRLQKCSPQALKRLKRQLSNFNSRTGRWHHVSK